MHRTGLVDHSGSLRPRTAARIVGDALADTRVVTITGARQTGKSTLARLIAGQHAGAVVRLLDDAATRRAAVDDPAGFVGQDGLQAC